MLPTRPEELTSAWLTEALQARHPGVTVTGAEVRRAGDGTNHHAMLELEHDGSFASTVFVKLPPLDPTRRARLDWASMGQREVRFYQHLAPQLGFRVPDVHVALLEEAEGDFVLVMEELGAAGCEMPDPVAGVSVDLVERALVEFAGLHVAFETAGTRRARAPWLGPSGRTSEYGARLLREGIDAGAPLSAEFVAVAERYIGNRDRLQDAWELGPTTVLHGDAHLGNVFVDKVLLDTRLGLFDWGLMTVGSPLRDVSYFVTMCLAPEQRAAHERALIDAYLDARGALGGIEVTGDEAWWWHRLQSAYTVVASCQAIDVPATASPARRAFSAAFVERASRAVAELDAAAAIDSFLSA